MEEVFLNVIGLFAVGLAAVVMVLTTRRSRALARAGHGYPEALWSEPTPGPDAL